MLSHHALSPPGDPALRTARSVPPPSGAEPAAPAPAAGLRNVLAGSVAETLASAGRLGTTSHVEVTLDGLPVGFVVLLAGRVAWAVCRDQTEDLGSFLLRLGKVRREQLVAVRQRFQTLGGQIKLGALLEEAGILRRPVLRRCLLLHTRRALSCLLEYSGARASAQATRLEADRELTFPLEEVLPDRFGTEHESPAALASVFQGDWTELAAHNAVLAPLAEMPAYLASVVVAADGEVLLAHSARPDLDPALLGVTFAMLVDSAERDLAHAHLGACEYLHFECAQGILLGRWLDAGRTALLATLLEREGNAGMARYKLNAIHDIVARKVSLRPKEPA